MKLSAMAKLLILVTVGSLVYIHIQMKIIDLAYQGKVKETQIRDLMERNGSATYNVLTLKSSSYLQNKLLVEDSNLQFADPQDIVRVSLPAIERIPENYVSSEDSRRSRNPLISLLSLRSR